jgi:membrane-anchored protein YejM (alkaline phosphatase superfamily)
MSASQVDSPVRRGLLRWASWFAAANALLWALVGTRYLLAFGVPTSAPAAIYVALAFIGQFALLGLLFMLVLWPLAALLGRRTPLNVIAVPLAALLLTLVVLDTNMFTTYRYHLSRLTAEIFEPATWVLAGIIFVVALIFQSLFSANVWRWLQSGRKTRGGWLALALVLVWLTGQGLHIWADAVAYVPITAFTRYLPLYFPVKAKRRLVKMGWLDPARAEQARLLRSAQLPDSGQLNYPLNDLRCAPGDSLPNVLFVLVDGLRPDHVTQELTPSIDRFADSHIQFSNHYSGGNSSRMGIFSMFYGLPSTYWQSFYDLQRGPVLLDQLTASGYEINAFSAVGFGSPAQIDRTLFAKLGQEHRHDTRAAADPNHAAAEAWVEWHASRGRKADPYFSFIYFDPGYSPVDEADAAAADSELATQYAEYVSGIAAVDREFATLLAQLERDDSARNTLVIVASDHGYEFDELGLGNVGHGSNYGQYQLRSVLLMDWPGRDSHVYSERSSHHDLPGTLLHEMLGCANPYSDYSSGGNLFENRAWPWIIAGSYNSHAIVSPDMIIVTYPGGLIEVLDIDYRPAPGLQIDRSQVESAMREMRRFYR